MSNLTDWLPQSCSVAFLDKIGCWRASRPANRIEHALSVGRSSGLVDLVGRLLRGARPPQRSSSQRERRATLLGRAGDVCARITGTSTSVQPCHVRFRRRGAGGMAWHGMACRGGDVRLGLAFRVPLGRKAPFSPR